MYDLLLKRDFYSFMRPWLSNIIMCFAGNINTLIHHLFISFSFKMYDL